MSLLRSALAATVLIFSAPSAFASAPDPRKPIDLSRYIGRWYEIARTPNKLQRDCIDATADYIQDGGRIFVVQTCQHPEDEEAEKIYRARARILDPETNAKLKLTFAGFWSQEYWVIDRAGDYSWAIVGDPSGKYLWVLARNPSIGEQALDGILQRVSALGYDVARLQYVRSREG